MSFWGHDRKEEEKALKGSKSDMFGFYKNTSYISISAFETLEQEISNSVQPRAMRASSFAYNQRPNMANSSSGLYRSQSVDNHHLVVSSVEPERRALYGSLPFVAQFGMHNREKSIRNVLVEANLAIEAQHRPLSLQFVGLVSTTDSFVLNYNFVFVFILG